MVDQVWVDPTDLFDGGALARSLGSGPPAILDRRTQPGHLGDGRVVLPGGVTQDRDHLGGAGRAGGDECGIRRMQSVMADRLRVSHTLGCQLVAVIVGVPPQLDVAHPPSSAPDRDERKQCARSSSSEAVDPSSRGDPRPASWLAFATSLAAGSVVSGAGSLRATHGGQRLRAPRPGSAWTRVWCARGARCVRRTRRGSPGPAVRGHGSLLRPPPAGARRGRGRGPRQVLRSSFDRTRADVGRGSALRSPCRRQTPSRCRTRLTRHAEERRERRRRQMNCSRKERA